MKIASFSLFILMLSLRVFGADDPLVQGQIRNEAGRAVSNLLSVNELTDTIKKSCTTSDVADLSKIDIPIKPIFNENDTTLNESATEIESALNICQKNAKLAQGACLETLSPKFGDVLTILGGAVSSVAMFQSTAEICRSSGSLMNNAKNAMTIYNTTCATAKASCDMLTCPRVIQIADEKFEAVQTYYSSIEGYYGVENFRKYVVGAKSAAYKFNNSCDKYNCRLVAAGIGIAQLAMQMDAAKKCEQAVANNGVLDCSSAANATNAICICQKNPRATGCPGTTKDPDHLIAPIGIGTASTSGKMPATPNIQMPADGAGTKAPDNSGGVDASASAGGGSGGSPGGGKGIAGLKNDPKGIAKKGIDTNIFGSDSGGGGGGRSGGGSGYAGGSGQASLTPEQLRKLASGTTIEVSGKTGKSNWDKIRERYTDNRAKLINQ